MKVLDVDCGDGALVKQKLSLLNPSAQFYGVDSGKELIRKANKGAPKNCKFLAGTAEKLPFKKSFFDEVHCYETLEHVVDEERSVKELARVLKKNGRLKGSVPHPASEKFIISAEPKYFSDVMHRRVFTKETLSSLLERHGFIVEEMRQKNFFDALAVTYQFAAKLGFEEQTGRALRRDLLFRILEALGFLGRSSSWELKNKLGMEKRAAWLYYPLRVLQLALRPLEFIGSAFYPKTIYFEAVRK